MDTYSGRMSPKPSDFIEWLVLQDDGKRRIQVGSSRHLPAEVLADTNRELYNVVFARWAARVKGGVHLDSGKPRPGFS